MVRAEEVRHFTDRQRSYFGAFVGDVLWRMPKRGAGEIAGFANPTMSVNYLLSQLLA